MYIVMDLMKICLFELVNVKMNGRELTDDEAAELFHGLLSGLDYLHQ